MPILLGGFRDTLGVLCFMFWVLDSVQRFSAFTTKHDRTQNSLLFRMGLSGS